jgi:hypothetical protein
MATVLPPTPPTANSEKGSLYDLIRSQQRQQQEQFELESEEEQSEIVPGIGYIEDGPGLVSEGSNE